MLLTSHLGIKVHSQCRSPKAPSGQFHKWLMWGFWGCIVRDLETIIGLVLLAFNFIPQWSYYSLTMPRSWFRDSATVTLMPGDGTTAIKVELFPKLISLFSSIEKKTLIEVYRRDNSGPKTLLCGTSVIHCSYLLTSLRQQPFMCCDWFDINCQYWQHRTSNTHRAELIENSLMVAL